jgi:hypothetical protein
MTSQRGPEKTCCPSEIPRLLLGNKNAKAWRECMPLVRKIAIELVKEGKIEILQRGRVVSLEEMGEDGEDIKGPIRLRMCVCGGVCG